MAISEPIPKEPTIVEPQTGEKPVIKVESPQVDYEKQKNIIRNKLVIWYVFLVVEALLSLRFLLKLFGANPSSFFSILIMVFTTPLTFIFSGLFPTFVSQVGNAVLEWTTLFAMLVYGLVSFLVAWFYRIQKPIDPKEAEEKVEELVP